MIPAKALAVIKSVAASRLVPISEILSPTRGSLAVIAARHDAIRQVKALNPEIYTSPKLGEIFQRDHTTILYALGRIKKFRQNCSSLRAQA